MKTPKFLALFLLLGITTAKAQVGINTTNPHPTAVLHIHSQNQGVLLPTLPPGKRTALATGDGTEIAAEGLLVYDPEQRVYFFFNSTTGEWLALNPFQVREKKDTSGAGGNDVRLAPHFQDRNVVIGGDAAHPDARLHVHGNLRAEIAHIVDSLWSAKIESLSLITQTAEVMGQLVAGTTHVRGNLSAAGELSVAGNGRIGNFTIGGGDITGSHRGNDVRVSADNLLPLSTFINPVHEQISTLPTTTVSGSVTLSTTSGGVPSNPNIGPQLTGRYRVPIGSFELDRAARCWFDFHSSFRQVYPDMGLSVGITNSFIISQNGVDIVSNMTSGQGGAVLLQPGEYQVKFEFEVQDNVQVIGIVPLVVMEFNYAFNGGYRIEDNNQTIFAADGMVSVFNEIRYFYYSHTHGLEVRTGNHGIRLNSVNGLQRRLSNGQWVPIQQP